MNKLAKLISTGEVSPEDLVEGQELMDRALLVNKALKACKKTLVFPLGETEIACYRYMDRAGEYEAWGSCTSDGQFTCYCNWGGDHKSGSCNLTNFSDVFMAFENNEFAHDLHRFLMEQIKKAE